MESIVKASEANKIKIKKVVDNTAAVRGNPGAAAGRRERPT